MNARDPERPTFAQERRKAGRLPTRDEWQATQPRKPGRVARLLSRLRAG